jgi:hypothetical protein
MRLDVGDHTPEALRCRAARPITNRRDCSLRAQLFPCWEHQVGDFPWMVRAPAQESHRSAVASRMSLG